jgi:hypothetical protein
MSARLGRAPLDAAAPLRPPPPLDEHANAALPAVRDSAIEPRAALGPHATLDLMPNWAVLALHPNQSVTLLEFVPAETTDYICRP